MDKKTYVVIEGAKRVIEWYFDDRKRMRAKEYWTDLEEERQDKIVRLFRYMAERGEIKHKEKFIHEGDSIYAFKTHDDRFFCFFFEGAKVIITNAYEKKGQKMPLREKDKALACREDYIERVKSGDYYDKES